MSFLCRLFPLQHLNACTKLKQNRTKTLSKYNQMIKVKTKIQLTYFLRFFAALNCTAADLKSKVPSVSSQLAMRIRRVTLSSARRLRCAVLILFHWIQGSRRLSWPVWPTRGRFHWNLGRGLRRLLRNSSPHNHEALSSQGWHRVAHWWHRWEGLWCWLVLAVPFFAKMTNNGPDGWFSILLKRWGDRVIMIMHR